MVLVSLVSLALGVPLINTSASSKDNSEIDNTPLATASAASSRHGCDGGDGLVNKMGLSTTAAIRV